MAFGEKLGKLLKERGLTQTKFAEDIGASRVMVNHYVTGSRTPSFEFLKKTIEYFGDVDLNWLMREGGELANEAPTKYEVPQTPQTILANVKVEIKKLEELLAQK